MAIDKERVLQKIAYIREQVSAIEELVKTSGRQEILNDPWKLRGVKYALQTAIEAVIDIAYHIVAKKYSYPPADARDALRVLEKNGVISSDDFDNYTAMVGFRNRLVHGYQEISPERLYELITNRLVNFERFSKSVTEIIRVDELKV
ncbi:hypothetical protein MHOCP_06720 [Moorella humiferrea]|uniref:type VII toxin-antitoxin system HepT family RNase toxin n=1 Tax=Neomoorella humiferrea TaxID=676965 RepID=UPI0030CE17AA